MNDAKLGLAAALVILVAALWISITVIPVFGSHNTPVTDTHYMRNVVRAINHVDKVALPVAPNSLSITNEKAVVWLQVYRQTYNNSGASRAVEAANQAVANCYGK